MKNEKCKMKNGKCDLSERILDFTAAIVKLTGKLSETYTTRHISGQLMRAATSAGANYEEACGAESRPDFIHKMQIVLKELREALYWLRLMERSELVVNDKKRFMEILQETKELANIMAKSIVTARNNA